MRLSSAPDDRPDVVHIIARMNLGGPASQVMHLCEGLAPQWRSMLITGNVDTGEVDVLQTARAKGLTVTHVPELGRRIRPTSDLSALAQLVSLLRGTRPKIVWTHTAKAGTLGRLAARVAGVPRVIHSYHGHVFHGYFSKPVSGMVVRFERQLARITDRIVTLSDSQRCDIIDVYRIAPASKVRTIPLGVDVQQFLHPPEKAGESFRREFADGNEKIVTIVGRLAPIKRHDLFISAAAKLLQSGMKVRFVIVGGGSEEGRLRQITQSQRLERDVRFAGWRTDLAEVYGGSDVIVLCSDNEGTPVTLIEALAAGVPVVATRAGGVSDLLLNGTLGHIVAPGDSSALANAIQEVLRNEQSRDHAIRGRASVVNRFGVARLLSDADLLLKELTETTED